MDEKGFGLLEALLAAMVACLVAAAALPRIVSRHQVLQLEQEATELASALTVFREESIYAAAQRQEFLDASEHQVPVLRFTKTGYTVACNTKIKRRHTVASGIQLIPNRSTAEFYGTGSAQPMTIQLCSGQERRYVIIDVAGRIRVSLTPP